MSTKFRLFACFLVAVAVIAQSPAVAYLRSSTPSGVTIVGTTNNITPVQILTGTPHNLSVGDTVYVSGVCGTTNANGIRKVKVVISTTNFSITNISNVDITWNATWDPCLSLGDSPSPSAKFVGKVAPFTLVDHPRVFMDGPNGTITRQWALGTSNGLTSLVVSNNLATVTTSFNHVWINGDKVAIWNSGNSSLDYANAGRVITKTGDTTFTFVTSGVSNGTYSASNMRLSGWAMTDNFRWVKSVQITTDALVGNAYQLNSGIYGGQNKEMIVDAALRYLVDRTWTTGRDMIVWILQRPYTVFGTGFNFPCDERQSDCSWAETDYWGWFSKGFGFAYSVVRDYIQATLTTEEKTALYNVWFADPDFGDDCTPSNPTPVYSETATAQNGSWTTITLASSASATDNYYTNKVIKVVTGPGSNGTTLRSSIRKITTYNGTTKIATVEASAWEGTFVSVGTQDTWAYGPISTTIYDANGVAFPDEILDVPRTKINQIQGTTWYNQSLSVTTASDGITRTYNMRNGWNSTGKNYLQIQSPWVVIPQTGDTWTYFPSTWPDKPTSVSTYVILAQAISHTGVGGTMTFVGTQFLNHSDPTQRYNAGDVYFLQTLQVASYGDIGTKNILSMLATPSAAPSNTTLTITTYPGVWPSAQVPMNISKWPQWTNGTCGFLWRSFHHTNGPGQSVKNHPPTGGISTSGASNNQQDKITGSLDISLAMADDDPRPLILLQQAWNLTYDTALKFNLNYHTGFAQSGSSYSYERTISNTNYWIYMMKNSVSNWINIPTTTPAVTKPSMFWMHSLAPSGVAGMGLGTKTCYNSDTAAPTSCACLTQFRDSACLLPYGTDTRDLLKLEYNLPIHHSLFNFSAVMNPTDPNNAYYNDWMDKIGGDSKYQRVQWSWMPLITRNPNAIKTDYTTQSRQYLFNTTGYSACTSLIGDCTSSLQAGGWTSRKAWNDANSSFVFLLGLDYVGDHSTNQQGHYEVHKGTPLIADDTRRDSYFSKNYWYWSGQPQISDYTNMIQIGTPTRLLNFKIVPIIADAQIVRWAGTNPTGDSQNRYVYSMIDLTNIYDNNAAAMRVQRHIIHMKALDKEELVLVYDDVTANSKLITSHIHYTHNNETDYGTLYHNTALNEGNTICVSGCSGLNTTREIQTNNKTYNLTTKFLTPTGVDAYIYEDSSWSRTDTSDNIPRSFNRTNPDRGNNNPNVFRVSYCAGTGSCNASATAMEVLAIHKIGANLSDTSLIATKISGTDWFGVQTSDKVIVNARGGVTKDNATISTSHTGTFEYLFTGLTPGIYNRYLNTVQQGGDLTVAEGDTTLYYTSTAGTHALVLVGEPIPGISIPVWVTTSPLPDGTVNSVPSYSKQFVTTSCSGACIYAKTIGAYPPGLSLTGDTLSGTPTTAGDYTFTISATGEDTGTESKEFTLRILPASGGGPSGQVVLLVPDNSFIKYGVTSIIVYYGTTNVEANNMTITCVNNVCSNSGSIPVGTWNVRLDYKNGSALVMRTAPFSITIQ